MEAAVARKIESTVTRIAAAAFGGALGFSSFTILADLGAQPSRMALALGAAAIGYLGCERLLASIDRRRRFPVPVFDVASIEPMDELQLTQAEQLQPAGAAVEPLELDDVLAEIGPDARVVRLFDRSAMPTPGQLKARIDRHLGDQSGPVRPSDDSEALYEALSELRRSLR